MHKDPVNNDSDKEQVDPFDPALFHAAPSAPAAEATVAETPSADTLKRHAALKAKRHSEFYTVYADGVDELVRRTRNGLAIVVALEAVRLVATGRAECFRLSADATHRWKMSCRERQTVVTVLRRMPDLFSVPPAQGKKAVTVIPTQQAIDLLFRKRGD